VKEDLKNIPENNLIIHLYLTFNLFTFAETKKRYKMIEEKLKALCTVDNTTGENLPTDQISIKAALSICKQEIEDAKPKWISVKDKLPEPHEKVIASLENGWNILLGVVDLHNKWLVYYTDGLNEAQTNLVTHWMPLPEVPKEK